MLAKKERLTKKEFDRSFSLGKRLHSPSLQIIFHQSPTFHGAVVVGKKVHKKAVDRNALRRSLYGVLYRFHKEHTLAMTVLVIAKPAIRDLSSKQRREALYLMLQKLS
jgi:ribonuclease P protein component